MTAPANDKLPKQQGDVYDEAGGYRIVLVDAPDQPEPDGQFIAHAWESQRTYRIFARGLAGHLSPSETVRIRRHDTEAYTYVVENLVAKRWHTLLRGSTIDNQIPFDEAVLRACNVLL